MTPDQDRLERLAGEVADGLPIDWDAATRSAADEEERQVLENLRSLQSLAAAARGRKPSPAVWNGLKLREPLGKGAFGDVFLAWDPKLQREVALKLVPVSQPDIDALALEEGRLLARVRHPNVVTVYGAEISDGWSGLWMERIQGRTLAAILNEKGPLDTDEVALVGIDVAHALAAVHAAGIIHCDIKPSNVMRDETGRTVLMDFGIGRRAGTAVAQAAGTPAFMAPETLRGEPANVRTDIYMVGALLFALTIGRPPGGTPAPGLRDLGPGLPEPFRRAVDRALDADPARRWSSADEMAAALTDAFGLPSRTGRRRRWLAASTAVAAIAVLVALWTRPAPRRSEPERRRPESPPAASPTLSTPPATLAATTASPRASGDPFVAPVGVKGPVSDATGPAANASAPFSIRAAWHPQRAVPELEIRASRPVSVYLVREEQPSRCFLLFPLPGRGQQNPLGANLTHRLPAGTPASRAQGRLLLVASPSPLAAFEDALARSRVPLGQTEHDAIRLAEKPLSELRSLEAAGAGRGDMRPLFESAPRLSGHTEIVQGPWIRLLAAP